MASPGDYGLFVNTTQVWDVASQLQNINVNTPEFKELLVRMYMDINRIALAVNQKETGTYAPIPNEFVDGNQWFPNPAYTSQTAINPTLRQEFRTVINFGMLPNTTTQSVAHGIGDPVTGTLTSFTFTRIYAVASDTTARTYIPIPFVDVVTAGAADIQIDVDAVYVNITTASNRTNYTVCYVVLEYIKN
jgi:hypothetical protein